MIREKQHWKQNQIYERKMARITKSIARKCKYVWQPCDHNQAIFFQNILLKNCTKSNLEQYSLKKFVKILIFQQEYIKMCFHGNRHPSSIKYPLISSYFKYYSLKIICFLIMNSPIFPSLDDIYCTQNRKSCSKWAS